MDIRKEENGILKDFPFDFVIIIKQLCIKNLHFVFVILHSLARIDSFKDDQLLYNTVESLFSFRFV